MLRCPYTSLSAHRVVKRRCTGKSLGSGSSPALSSADPMGTSLAGMHSAGMQAHGDADCFVCQKHGDPGLMPGGPAGEDELVSVSHLTPRAPGHDGGPVYLGYLFVEPRRHIPGLADLTEPEAQAVGSWCARASRALRDVAGADHVYAAVLGNRAPHLHVHLVARYPGTPREFWGLNADEWPGAERGTESQVAGFVARLRAYLIQLP